MTATTPTTLSFVGCCFHRFGQNGQITRQGIVRGMVNDRLALVQYFEWVLGLPSTLELVPVELMTTGWQFYEDEEEMKFCYTHHYRVPAALQDPVLSSPEATAPEMVDLPPLQMYYLEHAANHDRHNLHVTARDPIEALTRWRRFFADRVTFPAISDSDMVYVMVLPPLGTKVKTHIDDVDMPIIARLDVTTGVIKQQGDSDWDGPYG